MKSIKSQNNKYIWSFILFNTLLFFILLFNYEFTAIVDFVNNINIKNILLIFLAPVIAIVLNGVLTSNQKAVVIFWRIKNPLPSSRVFSNLIDADSRIDKNLLKTKFSEFPVSPNEQSQLWYKIYKKNQNEIIVLDSHKAFLLTRDLCSLAFMFLLLFSIAIIFSASNFKLFYSVYMIFQFLLLSLSARNYGNKFTLNVLAEEMK